MENSISQESEFNKFKRESTVAELRELFYKEPEPDEEFRPIVTSWGLSEYYEISRKGHLRDIGTEKYRKWTSRNKLNSYPNFSSLIIAPQIKLAFLVHRLVAQTYWNEVHQPDWVKKLFNQVDEELKFRLITDLLVVDHIDNNGWNPEVSNLCWTSTAENSRNGVINWNRNEKGANIKKIMEERDTL